MGGPPEEGKIIRSRAYPAGTMHYHLHCEPAFDYARAEHVIQHTDYGAAFHTDALKFSVWRRQSIWNRATRPSLPISPSAKVTV